MSRKKKEVLPTVQNSVDLSANTPTTPKRVRKRTSEKTTSDNHYSVSRLTVEEKWVSANKIKEKPTEWLLAERISKGNITLLDARKEMGKSTILGMLAAEYSNGRDLFGNKLRHPSGKVLWVTHEESYAGEVVPRFKQYGGNLAKLMCPTDYRWLNEIRIPSCMDKLADFIKEHSIGLIILDPFTSLKDPSVSTTDTDAMRHYMECLYHSVSSANVTLIANRHLTKNRRGDALDQGVGSTQIAAVARTVLRIDYSPLDKEKRLLWVVATNKSEKPLPYQFSIVGCGKPFPLLQLEEEVFIDKEEIMDGDQEIGEVDEKTDADMILTGILRDGAKWSKEVIAEGKEAGVGDRTLRKAKARLKIKSERRQMADTSEMRVYWLPPAAV